MKLLFAHDHRFFRQDQEYFSNAFSYSLWERYLSRFSSVTVAARVSSSPPPGETRRSSGQSVSFAEMPPVAMERVGLPGPAYSNMVQLVQSHDAVVARLPSEYGLLAITAAEAVGKPFLVEVVGSVWDALWNHGSLTARCYAPLALLRMRKAASAARLVLYVSEFALQNEYPSAPGALTVAASNVELPQSNTETLRRRSNRIDTRGQEWKLGLIGSMDTGYKGIHIALDALSKVADLPWSFHILGPGDPSRYRSQAKRLKIADRVHFSGTLQSGSKVFEWLDNVDLYLQPSLQEGVPRALLEAMSRGCPAVASDAGGIPELLASDCIVPAGSSERLAKKLRAILLNKNWAMHQAETNFKKAQEYETHILAQRRHFIISALEQAAQTVRAKHYAISD